MYELLIRTPFLIYLASTFALVGVLEVGYWIVRWRIARNGVDGVPAIFNSYVEPRSSITRSSSFGVWARA